jgi:hypothetical protein
MKWNNANILFADVKGYIRLDDRGMQIFHEKVLSSLNDVMKDVSIHSRNTWGDGIVFISDQIEEICEAALLLRDKFQQIRWSKLNIDKLDIRISIHHGQYLGSGLIDQSQKMTVAAMAMAEKKVWAHRS